jgi:Skp family chaperone for outer membrane proteins
MHMKLFKIFIPILLLLSFTSVRADEDKYIAKIAVVDVESILENSLAISSIRKSIDELSVNIQKEVTEKEEAFKKYEEELIQKRDKLSSEKFDALVAEFNKNVSNVQKNVQLKKRALEQAHSKAIETVHEATISIIGELSKKYNVNIVLPSNQVLFVSNDLNITHEVVSNLNEKLKEVKIDLEKFLKKSS